MVKIHGKEYITVAERLAQFHKDHKDSSIETGILKESSENGTITVKAIVTFDSRTFTGHASEVVGQGNINKTSALENAETSAIGRALASAGYMGTEFASADEMVVALSQQKKEPKKEPKKESGVTPPQKRIITALRNALNITDDLNVDWLTKERADTIIKELKQKAEEE